MTNHSLYSSILASCPQDIGLAVGPRLSDSVGAELRRRGATKGTCEPPLDSKRGSPRCTAALPGYVVRFSPIFKLRGDSVQVYVYAQKYDNATSGNSDPLRFERPTRSFRTANGGAPSAKAACRKRFAESQSRRQL